MKPTRFNRYFRSRRTSHVGIVVAVVAAFGFVGVAASPSYGAGGIYDTWVGVSGPNGDWQVTAEGWVDNSGVASYGDLHGVPLNAPIVSIAGTPDAKGYWLVASDGGVFAFGDGTFEGSLVGETLARPVVGIAAGPDAKGYWLVASDGGVFAFGDAHFYGSMGGKPLIAPIVGIASTPDGLGYWLVASDGGVFAFGDAHFYGSMGGKPLNKPVVGIGDTPDGQGYWMVAADGGVFAFGDAQFCGSGAGNPTDITSPVIGIVNNGLPFSYTIYLASASSAPIGCGIPLV